MLAKQNKGYTLLEVMMALAIAGILLAVGVPGLTSFVKNNRMLAETNGLMTVLKTARSEAMTQRTNVTVCRTANSVNCGGTGDNYMAFTDTGTAGEVDGTDAVLLTNPISSETLTITYTKCGSSPIDRITFSSRGTAINNNGFLTVSDDRGSDYSRGIVVEPIGRSSSIEIGVAYFFS